MWIKTGDLRGNLPVWVMAGLGITMALYSSQKLVNYCNKKRGVLISRGKNDDRINQLPDDILCDIISRLEGIEAARTSILSRGWRTLNPEITFFCPCKLQSSKHYRQSFFKAINKCLKLYSSRNLKESFFCPCKLQSSKHDRQSFFKSINKCLKLYSSRNLKEFTVLCCFLDGHEWLVEQWMQTASSLGVESIYLGNPCESHFPNPKAFTFSFKLIEGASRLRTLTLMSCNLETSCNGQIYYSLVSLKLDKISLCGRELAFILLFACPNLRSLSLYDCKLPPYLMVYGNNLKLETLTLRRCVHVQKLDISSPNLVTINIQFCTKVKLLFSSIPKVANLYLDNLEKHNSLEDVLMDLPKLNCLLVQATYQIPWLPPTFTVFGNVRKLYLLSQTYLDEKVDLWNFAPALSACPLLVELYISACGIFTEESRYWPILRHKHLSYVELAGFSNKLNQLEFAKFILRSAEELFILVLRTSCRIFSEECFQFRKSSTDHELKLTHDNSKVICASLERHVLPRRVSVKMCKHSLPEEKMD